MKAYSLLILFISFCLRACSQSPQPAEPATPSYPPGDQTYVPGNVRKVLDKQQKAAFNFFYEGAEPESGLALEGNNRGNTVTIGGGGFGVMALVVGMERGWISRAQGIGQINKILTFLSKADRYKGVWSHWHNPDGTFAPFGDQSATGDLVETSFLVQGLIVAREYLDKDTAEEKAIRETIDRLYDEIDWAGYTGTSQDGLYWLWYSRDDKYSLKISGWNEALCTYLLALGAEKNGISADIAVSAVECARVVIAQVSPNIPYLYGKCLIHESEISAAVYSEEPPLGMVFGEPTPIEAAIGANVASQIPDGACLQIGVGGIPNAVLNGIKHHQHLGLHTEAMTDGVIRLIKEGVIDNSLKKVHPGVSVAALAIGSAPMYKFIDHNPTMEFFDVAYTNDPFLIAQNPRACAINSAIEVDLTGQICADSIGEMIFSSVGGQHDFMYGCALAEGGRTFIALPSRTAKGKAKIVPTLTPGAGVVTTRFQTQFVATEYGIVYLRGKSLAERAKLLISIAHPDDREELEKAACKRFGYSFLRLKAE